VGLGAGQTFRRKENSLTSSKPEHRNIQPSQPRARKSNLVVKTENAGSVDAAATCLISSILPYYAGRHLQLVLSQLRADKNTLKTDKAKSFFTRPSSNVLLKFLRFTDPGECGPLSRAEVYGNCYSGRRRPVLVTCRAKCRLAIDARIPGLTPAHIYDFFPHVHAGTENRWTLCAIPSSHDSSSEGYIRDSVLFGS